MANMQKSTATLRLACILTLMVANCDKSGAASSSPVSSGAYAELGIVLTDLDEEEFAIESESSADIHVLAFWATWCVPCIGELAKMQGVEDRLGSRGVHIYAISIDGPDTISRVPGFAAQEGWSFPVLYDSDTAVMSRWNPKGDCPFYVVLDAEGNVLKTHQGYVKGDVAALERFLNEQLAAQSPSEPAA